MRPPRVRRTSYSPIVYECERCLQINASADTVWDWMADARRLLGLNIFHVAVPYPEPVMRAGCVYPSCTIFGGSIAKYVSRVFAPTVSILWHGENSRNTALTAFRTANRSRSYRSTRRPVSSSIVCVGSSVFLGRGIGSYRYIGSLPHAFL